MLGMHTQIIRGREQKPLTIVYQPNSSQQSGTQLSTSEILKSKRMMS